MQVATAAPAIFTANANGQGVPAAVLLGVAANGQQTYEAIAQFDTTSGTFRPKPISFGAVGDRVFLILYLCGIRNANANSVRVLIGGQAITPDYAGSQGGLAGLNQINVELPRSLTGNGLVTLSVSAVGAATSNEVGIEIASVAGTTTPQITSLSASTVLAGQELVINGANFSATAAENSVRVLGDETQPEAQILEAASTRLRVLVPFGASSGKVAVRTSQGEGVTASPLTMRTSVSGFVQDNKRQAIRGVTVRLVGTNISAQTNAEGAFILPDTPASLAATIEIDGTTVPGGLPYPKQQFKLRVRTERDNQVNGYIELKQATGPSITVGSGFNADQSLITTAEWRASASVPEGQLQTGQVILDIPNNATVKFPNGATNGSLTLTVLESGRTPGTLPAGQFSPVIAQLTPFGATITPGAKLTFPNPDGYAANTQLKLYRYDQTPDSPTLGSFVEAGAATVSADGQRIERAPNAVTETSYYFASGSRPMITLIGRVVENNLNHTPVRRALVNARGQGIFTDGFGGFVIRNVPINASGTFAAQLSGEFVIANGELVIGDDRVGVESDFMRPSRRVDRSQHEDVPPVANGQTVSPDLVLSSVNANRAPTIFAPANITMNAGTTREVTFFASDPDPGQTVQVTVSGASFAAVSKGSADSFTLRLTPGTNDGGNYTLTLTVSDGQGGTNTQNISLRVNGVGVTADDQVVIVDKNTAKAIRLTGSDPLGRPLTFVIVSQPSRGALGGTAPNVTYTPARDYVGADSFTFKVRAGQVESNEAAVTIRVRGSNSAPVLTVPGNLSVNGGETLKFTVTASDPDAGQPLKFEVQGKPDGATIIENPTNLQFSWTPTVLQTRSYEVTFKVTDNGTPPLSDTKL